MRWMHQTPREQALVGILGRIEEEWGASYDGPGLALTTSAPFMAL